MPRLLHAALGAVALSLTLVGCAAPAEPVTVADDTIIIDVRTPSEYADGHLDGALSYDLNGGQLAASMDELDADAEYLVYCASGNRSSQAVRMMADAGLTDVTDLGGVAHAAEATGLPIVR
ncbi:rhodanese-like domain-containing protein [Microbacterium sp. zg.Y1084]|uniref:rhodanese-like domain-containing protein n=1 Tax=Microbacterium sp. zg.Y1084 TaxID=2969667 RepID=UPI00214C8512|nr:rhodanese-like domain-containing protein [Microbacterium sp. zg.Y1084]MCR2812923.1 rhodanese-like domain-containing protein [Microbacterium sp. zg.Y1084]